MKNIKISWIQKDDNDNFDTIVLFGGEYKGEGWEMTPEAMAMAIHKGLYSFYVKIFQEEIPVILIKNEDGNVIGLGTPKDEGPLQFLRMLPDRKAAKAGYKFGKI